MSRDIEKLIPVIRKTIEEIIEEKITPRLDNLDYKICELTRTLSNHGQRLNEVEKSIQHTGDDLLELKTKTIPDLENKFKDLTSKMCMNMLDSDLYKRKWNLIMNGVEGIQGENENTTRTKVKAVAKNDLKVSGVDSIKLSACHRLAQTADAGIIIRFCDLKDRNQWLQNAKNLKDSNSGISISPDLPPTLRPLKSDILKQRKSLPPETRRNSKVKYHPTWPYVSLSNRNQPTINPRITKEAVVKSYLDHTKITLQ